MREFLLKFANMDRRFVFLGVAIFVVVPLVWPWGLPIIVRNDTQRVYDEVDKARDGGKPVLVSFDFDPGTKAELLPMAEAIMRHTFANEGRLLVLSFMPTGAGLAESTLFRIADERGATYGEDFLFFGYDFPPTAKILGIGEDVALAYPRDYKGVDTRSFPMMEGIKNYKDIQVVVDLAGNSMPESWIAYGVGRYDANFTMGVTAVMAPDYKPFLLTGQSKGMLGGMRGAAEYEKLLLDRGIIKKRGVAMRGMDPQSAVHLFIIVMIVLGNLAYFLTRKK
jgi:hypothetical protein